MPPNMEPAFLLEKIRLQSLLTYKTETLWRFLIDRQLRIVVHEMFFGFSLLCALARKTRNIFFLFYLDFRILTLTPTMLFYKFKISNTEINSYRN